GTVALLAILALPVLAVNRTRSEQVVCASNLRQVGHAFHLWANDHGDLTPWLTPTSQGGTYLTPNALKNEPYYQIGVMSNELVTPKILVCPSDQGVGVPRRMAMDFSASSASGGF